MNSLERMRATLDGRPADRIPVMTQVFGYAAVSAGIDLPLYYRGGTALADAQIHALRRFGSDAVFTFTDGNIETEAMGGRVEYPRSSYPFLSEHPFSAESDPDRIRIPDPSVDGRMPGILKATRIINRAIGETTLIAGITCGPLTLMSQWLGLEQALVLAIEDAPRFQQFLRRAETVSRSWGIAQLEAGAHLIYLFDPVASPSVVPAGFFREFEAPPMGRILDSLEEAGNLCRALHITGPTEALFPHYEGIRVELANVDYEVDLLRVAARWPNLAVNGNIRPLLLQEDRPNQLLAESERLLAGMVGRGRFILSPGCEAPLGTRPENLLAFCSSVYPDADGVSGERKPRLTVTRAGSEEALIENAPVEFGESLVEALRRMDFPIVLGCAGIGSCGRCGVRIKKGKALDPSTADQIHFDEKALADGRRLACQFYVHETVSLELSAGIRESRWRELFPAGMDLCGEMSLSGVEVGRSGASSLLLDLGTSRLELSRLDSSGRLDRVLAHANPQGNFGADIISRAQAAVFHPQALAAMRRGLADVIHKGCLALGIDPVEGPPHQTLAVVGNTVMLCLFAGQAFEATLAPANWTRPIVPSLSPDDSFWSEIFPRLRIDLVDPVGGFVGSDLMACLLGTGLTESEDAGLLVDFGTNSEVALWSGSDLWIASAAGGPAFEGCGLVHVGPAEKGTIRSCRIGGTGEIHVDTIGDAPPTGFCMTGVIDLIADYLERGWIDPKGNVLHHPDLGLPFDWRLEKSDLDQIQRGKAGIGATIDLLMDRAAVRSDCLSRICLAGQVGETVNPSSARRLGMIPDVDPDRVERCPHLPLRGAGLWALSEPARIRASNLARRANLISPALEEDFEDRYVEHLYLRPISEPLPSSS